MDEYLSLGRGDHRRELIEIADEDHLHTAEPQLVAGPIEAQEFLDAIEEVCPYHGHLVDDDRVDFPKDVAFPSGDLLDLIGGDARLEAEEGVDRLAFDVEGRHAGGSEYRNLFFGGPAKMIEKGRLARTRLSGDE